MVWAVDMGDLFSGVGGIAYESAPEEPSRSPCLFPCRRFASDKKAEISLVRDPQAIFNFQEVLIGVWQNMIQYLLQCMRRYNLNETLMTARRCAREMLRCGRG